VARELGKQAEIQQANLVRLQARREQPNLPAVSIPNLLNAALRLRPDRILLGKVRGGEAFDLLQAPKYRTFGHSQHDSREFGATCRFTIFDLCASRACPHVQV
jgi:hypothetical protein